MLRLLFIVILVFTPLTALAQDATPEVAPAPAPEPIAPYDPQLLRLAEVLGSVHYLRALCKAGEGSRWRDAMAELVTLEEPTPTRRARLIARFNRGYRGLDETYSICTPSARVAGDRYIAEAVELTDRIVARFGR